MSYERLLTETVTVLHTEPSGTDAYGNEVPGPVTMATYPARLEQRGTTELTADRATVTSTWLLFLPDSAEVTAHDRVEVDGEPFEVVGRPARRTTPRGLHHLEAELRAVV